MLSFIFGTKKRQISELELTACYSKGATLLAKVKTFSGLFGVLELAQEINKILPDGFMLQIPGHGTITQSKGGLVLAYIGDNGKVVRYTISRRDY